MSEKKIQEEKRHERVVQGLKRGKNRMTLCVRCGINMGEVKCLCGDPLNADTSLAVCALETAVKELAKEVKAIRERHERDMKDQWQMISELKGGRTQR